MKEVFQSIFSGFNYIMSLPEHLIEPLEFLPEFLKDALIDSLNLVPFLFIVFILIELLEHYFTKKRHLVVFFMKKIGPAFWKFICINSSVWFFCNCKYFVHKKNS